MYSLKPSFSLVALAVSVPWCVHAQAWINPKDQGTVSLLYQYGFDRYHVLSQGEVVDRGHTSLQATMLDVDYSLTDRLAVRVALPFIEGKYTGTQPHLLVRGQPDTIVELDDGRYHGGLQDFRFDVRYNVSQKYLMVTPFFQAIVPSHDYPTLGHGAAGTDQREYRVGVNFGRQLDPWLRKAYVQGRYAFGMVQETAHVAPKRSYVEFQLGYILSRRLSVQGSTVWTHSYNGIDFINGLFPNNLTEEQYLNHDRISRINLLDVGASSTYAITRKTNLFAGWGRSISGTNTHLRAIVLTVGVTTNFSARSREEKASALPSSESKKALVCTCAQSK
ncbi:MAG: hypothetical protein LAQ69_09745 [Acidobacteriia bacterium]|nr:hypothetical protein [Terriglobia bacterium]